MAARSALSLALYLAGGLLCASTRAEVSQSSASGFMVTQKREVRAPPAALVPAVGHVAEWWADEHTFSDHASNLVLETKAGACFCERWADGSVQHAQVIHVAPGIVRLAGALGPLQGLAVNGVLTLTVQPPAKGAAPDARNVLVVTYRVGGGEAADMQRLPAMVDGMMKETTDHLAHYLDR